MLWVTNHAQGLELSQTEQINENPNSLAITFGSWERNKCDFFSDGESAKDNRRNVICESSHHCEKAFSAKNPPAPSV